MIDAATQLDEKPEARTSGRRVLIATLVYAGLRIGEATALRRRDVDLANGRISVADSKTEDGIRLVDISPGPCGTSSRPTGTRRRAATRTSSCSRHRAGVGATRTTHASG